MAGTWEQIWVPGAGTVWDKQAMPFSLNNTYHSIGVPGPGPNFARDSRPARPVSAGSSRRMFTETHTLAGTTRPCDDPLGRSRSRARLTHALCCLPPLTPTSLQGTLVLLHCAMGGPTPTCPWPRQHRTSGPRQSPGFPPVMKGDQLAPCRSQARRDCTRCTLAREPPLTHQVRKAPSLFPSLANGLHTLTQAQRCTATRHVDTDTCTLPAQTLGLRQKYSQAPATIHSQTHSSGPVHSLMPSATSHSRG